MSRSRFKPATLRYKQDLVLHLQAALFNSFRNWSDKIRMAAITRTKGNFWTHQPTSATARLRTSPTSKRRNTNLACSLRFLLIKTSHQPTFVLNLRHIQGLDLIFIKSLQLSATLGQSATARPKISLRKKTNFIRLHLYQKDNQKSYRMPPPIKK